MKTAIITGAAGGIGVALCRAFRDAGYRVVATDRVSALPPDPPVGTLDVPWDAFVLCDLATLVADSAYRTRVRIELMVALGADNSLTTLVNNAAIQILGGVSDLTPDNWRQTLDINVVAPFVLSQMLLSSFDAHGGSIINVSSIHESLTKAGFVAYATSKAALSGLTRAMAVDLGPRIRVNAIAPAATSTPMLEAGFEGKTRQRAELDAAHPIGRIARADEVASVAVFLASDQAAFMSGSIVPVQGGIGARLHDPA